MTKLGRRTLKVLATLLILFIVVIIFKLFFALTSDYSTLDEPELFSLTLPEDTKYSSGYSHDKFGQIKLGMTEKQVIEILGEPLHRWRPYAYTKYIDKRHFVGLQYSESPTSTHYRLRQIYLDNGTVAEIIHYFYVD